MKTHECVLILELPLIWLWLARVLHKAIGSVRWINDFEVLIFRKALIETLLFRRRFGAIHSFLEGENCRRHHVLGLLYCRDRILSRPVNIILHLPKHFSGQAFYRSAVSPGQIKQDLTHCCSSPKVSNDKNS
jgi:hypothetical protein